MNQPTLDQGWQQLQVRIEGFLGQVLRNDVQRIEYKPRFIVQLLEMPSKLHQNERRCYEEDIHVPDGFSDYAHIY
jgi:hypothetical protein